MRLAMRLPLLLTTAAAFQLPLHAPPRADMSIDMSEDARPEVKVTIKVPAKKEEPSQPAADKSVFVANFGGSGGGVKKSLGTFLNLWMMGGCGGTEGWAGRGDCVAEHTPSGTVAAVEIDVEEGTLSLLSQSAPCAEGLSDLGDFTTALLDELEGLAKNEEVAAGDRLCHPSTAIDSVRLAAWSYSAPRA